MERLTVAVPARGASCIRTLYADYIKLYGLPSPRGVQAASERQQ